MRLQEALTFLDLYTHPEYGSECVYAKENIDVTQWISEQAQSSPEQLLQLHKKHNLATRLSLAAKAGLNELQPLLGTSQQFLVQTQFALRLSSSLCTCLGEFCAERWTKCGGVSEAEAIKKQIAKAVADSGLLPVLAQCCSTTSKALQQYWDDSSTQQQQQQQQLAGAASDVVPPTEVVQGLTHFGVGLLSLWQHLASMWPQESPVLVGSPMGPTVTPVADLAVKIITNWAKLAAEPAAALSAEAAGESSAVDYVINFYVDVAMDAGSYLSLCLRIALETDAGALTRKAALAVSAAPDVQQLMLLALGWNTHMQHKNLKGLTPPVPVFVGNSSSSSSNMSGGVDNQQQQPKQQQQQLPVKPYHLQLLAALGLKGIDQVPIRRSTIAAAGGRAMGVASCLNTVLKHLAFVNAATAGAPAARQYSADDDDDLCFLRDVLPAGSHVPLLLTLVEIQMLSNCVDACFACVPVMGLTYNMLTRESNRAPNSRPAASAAQRAAAATMLFAAIMEELGPVIVGVCNLNSARRVLVRRLNDDTAGVVHDLGQLLGNLAMGAEPHAYAPTYIKQPLFSCLLLEASVRQLAFSEAQTAAAMALMTSSSSNSEWSSKQPPHPYLRILNSRIVDAVKLAAKPKQATRAGVAGAAAADTQQLAPQLFSLLMTCLKYADSVACEANAWQVIRQADMISRLAMQLGDMIIPQSGTAAAAPAGSSSNDDNRRDASRLWAVLQAHCLLLLGKTLKQVCQQQQRSSRGLAGMFDAMFGGAAAQQQPDPVVWDSPHQVMEQIFEAVEWLRPHLKLCLSSPPPAAAAAAAATGGPRQQQQQPANELRTLLVQATELQGLYMDIVERSQEMFDFCTNEAALSKETKRVMDGPAAADKLEAFGHALCTQLPLRHCCNNPSCTSMDKLSELELASFAKCSGCKAAYYCSKVCQKVHWRQGHKEVCKRMQAALLAAEQAQPDA